MEPKVTVLMSVYNGEKYLKESIDSLLNQSFTDFEFLIINDASTDNSRKIISEFEDPRIRLIDNDENLGLTRSLNKGLELAKGQYIARMDCDDISLPERLSRQVVYMDSHPDVGVCGSWVKVIGEKKEWVWELPTTYEDIKSTLIFHSSLAHPAVMLNKRLLQKYNLTYNPDYKQAQDYDLWERCSKNFPLVNLDEVLLLYRVHGTQITMTSSEGQTKVANLVRERQFEALGIILTPEERDLHFKISTGQLEDNRQFIHESMKWLEKIFYANHEKALYPKLQFAQVLGRKWYEICAAGQDLWTWARLIKPPLGNFIGLNSREKLLLGQQALKTTIKQLL